MSSYRVVYYNLIELCAVCLSLSVIFQLNSQFCLFLLCMFVHTHTHILFVHIWSLFSSRNCKIVIPCCPIFCYCCCFSLQFVSASRHVICIWNASTPKASLNSLPDLSRLLPPSLWCLNCEFVYIILPAICAHFLDFLWRRFSIIWLCFLFIHRAQRWNEPEDWTNQPTQPTNQPVSSCHSMLNYGHLASRF